MQLWTSKQGEREVEGEIKRGRWRFNGGKKENGMISRCQGKERQLSGAKCDTRRDKQPLNQQESQVKILEFKAFLPFVCVADLSWLRGF